jgi:hypothetical protein
MPAGVPPKGVQPFPRYLCVPAGTFLWKVTRSSSASSGLVRSPFRLPAELEMDGARWGGRFDPSPDCPYPYCYAALDDLTALCEVLLRDFRFDAPNRYLPSRNVVGRSLVLLETLRPLWLVSLLDAADLAAACQDTWLVHTDSANFPITQLWAHWLRGSAYPDGAGPPAGIVWPSKRQPTGRTVLFFGDRCDDAVIYSSFGERRLDEPAGMAWLRRRLSLLRTGLGPRPPGTLPAAADS